MKINFQKKYKLLLPLLIVLSLLSLSAQTVTRITTLNNRDVPNIPDETKKKEVKPNPRLSFLNVLQNHLIELNSNLTIENFCSQNHIVTRRILNEYGAVFVGKGAFASPCFFRDEKTLAEAQKKFGISSQVIGGVKIELQPAAMAALLQAIEEAKIQGLAITPRGNSIAARRSFADTVNLWNSRVTPGLNYWMKMGKLTPEQVKQIRAMPIFDQITAILQLEEKRIFFSKDFSKSILNSVAAPGASQHNLMLAFDVNQYTNPQVRQIMEKHGWFQTVASDLPHFTYLGVEKSELLNLGLREVKLGTQTFWIPQMEIFKE